MSGADPAPPVREVVPSRRPSSLRKWLRSHLIERTLRRVPRGRDVLDLCCGYGFYFDINPDAAGFDGDPRCVGPLRARGLDVTLGNVLERLPYPDGRFGWVLAHDVLEHFTAEEHLLIAAEVHRVLRPGGRFVVIVPNRKGYDYGVRIDIGHRLFVTSKEIADFARGRFTLEASYAEPLPRLLGAHFTHNKEVFLLQKP